MQLDPKTPSVSGTWNLENDEDIRILLNRAPSRVSNIRPSTAGAESNFRGSSGGGDTRSTPTRPSSSGPSVPSRTKPESRQDNNPRPADCRGCARSRQTAVGGGKGGFFQGKGISRSDVVELRREMLIRSHGEGLNQDTFAVQRFETTAMGRRSHGQTVDRTEVRRSRNIQVDIVCLVVDQRCKFWRKQKQFPGRGGKEDHTSARLKTTEGYFTILEPSFALVPWCLRLLRFLPVLTLRVLRMQYYVRCRPVDSQTMRWLPAKTLNGLDRLQRSRMLMGKRPVVTRLRLWA